MISQDLNFAAGDKVRVHQKIQEGDKTRTQIFEGTVIYIKGRGINRTIQVQKMVGDIAVERIWPLASPNVLKIELKEKSKKKIRRANLSYLHVAKS
ncbi:MAG TPA: 50S ribosomal protein L19 [Patescibacteria group bacterium]|nr:50S ribosomal protein L19 [Patescibacteria group bacterium]